MSMNKDSAANASTDVMSSTPKEIIEKMKKIRAENDRVSVMEQFGISDNSWRKLRRGQPLRKSVVSRLIERLGQ